MDSAIGASRGSIPNPVPRPSDPASSPGSQAPDRSPAAPGLNIGAVPQKPDPQAPLQLSASAGQPNSDAPPPGPTGRPVRPAIPGIPRGVDANIRNFLSPRDQAPLAATSRGGRALAGEDSATIGRYKSVLAELAEPWPEVPRKWFEARNHEPGSVKHKLEAALTKVGGSLLQRKREELDGKRGDLDRSTSRQNQSLSHERKRLIADMDRLVMATLAQGWNKPAAEFLAACDAWSHGKSQDEFMGTYRSRVKPLITQELLGCDPAPWSARLDADTLFSHLAAVNDLRNVVLEKLRTDLSRL